MESSTEILTTVADVISALGGHTDVKTLTESESSQVVTNWLARNRFASHTYLIMTAALRAKGLEADPMLWGIKPPPHAEAAE